MSSIGHFRRFVAKNAVTIVSLFADDGSSCRVYGGVICRDTGAIVLAPAQLQLKSSDFLRFDDVQDTPDCFSTLV